MRRNSSVETSINIDSKRSKPRTTIDNLPSLAIEYILSQLTYYQLLQLRLVSRHWYSLIQGKFFMIFNQKKKKKNLD